MSQGLITETIMVMDGMKEGRGSTTSNQEKEACELVS